MKFIEAYRIAKAECKFIQAATERVIDAMTHGGRTPCYQFSIGKEAFYFGFDGVDLHKGKHSPNVSARLINNGETWVIR